MKKRYSLLVLLIIFYSNIFPNDSLSKIDSLNNLLASTDSYKKKCSIYLNIGAIHHELSNYNKALESYKKILLYENRLISDSDNQVLLYTYSSIAQI